MATIGDVAREAGVSKGTVSNVFSRKRPISREVSERVLTVSKELGYFPNHVARSLAIKKTMIVGLKMPISKESPMSGFEIQMVGGVIRECSRMGYRVLLDTLPEHDDLTQFSVDPVDGMIMLNPRKRDPRIDRYTQMAIPLVLVGRPDPEDDGISYVDNDNVGVAFQAGNYLLGSGHTSILFLNAAADMTVAGDRENGLANAFHERGMPFDPAYVRNYSRGMNAADYGYSSIMQTFGKLNYSAVITDTDRVAMGVYQAARELGIRIPDALSVIALSNDSVLAQETSPKLSCVELHAETLGTEAAKILIDKINGGEAVHQRIIEANPVIRESCSGGDPELL